jgi:hypothetical protein
METPLKISWDFIIVFPIVQEYLIREKFPDLVYTDAILDTISKNPAIQQHRIVRLSWCIHMGLRQLGYRKLSVIGKRYEKTNLGIIVPISPQLDNRLYNNTKQTQVSDERNSHATRKSCISR